MQIVLNYYDWEEPFIQSKKCYELIRKHGKQVIVMEPVKGGALARVPSGAELNYYKSFRSAYDLAFESGDHSKETAKIGGAFDVAVALKEAVKTQFENSFQSYVD